MGTRGSVPQGTSGREQRTSTQLFLVGAAASTLFLLNVLLAARQDGGPRRGSCLEQEHSLMWTVTVVQ